VKKSVIVLFILLLTGIFALNCSNDVKNDEGIDVDLSVLSITMAQAEFENIITNFEKYMGQVIRATGTYYSIIDDITGDYYHYIIIIPGDECCQMGFEFKRDGEYAEPDDYPERNAVIMVTGILSKGDDHGFPYLYLSSGEMTLVNR